MEIKIWQIEAIVIALVIFCIAVFVFFKVPIGIP